MNRAERRSLKRTIASKLKPDLKHPVPDSVVLSGGPMDGWIVKPDAPALEPDWRAKYLEEAARREFILAEQLKPEPLRQQWEDIPGEEREGWLTAARMQHADGRYELGATGKTAAWVAL